MHSHPLASRVHLLLRHHLAAVFSGQGRSEVRRPAVNQAQRRKPARRLHPAQAASHLAGKRQRALLRNPLQRLGLPDLLSLAPSPHPLRRPRGPPSLEATLLYLNQQEEHRLLDRLCLAATPPLHNRQQTLQHQQQLPHPAQLAQRAHPEQQLQLRAPLLPLNPVLRRSRWTRSSPPGQLRSLLIKRLSPVLLRP